MQEAEADGEGHIEGEKAGDQEQLADESQQELLGSTGKKVYIVPESPEPQDARCQQFIANPDEDHTNTEQKKPVSPYKLLRYSNIRQNDFSGYEDDEACLLMLCKPQANQGQTLQQAETGQGQEQTVPEGQEEPGHEYAAEGEILQDGSGQAQDELTLQQFWPLRKTDDGDNSPDVKNSEEKRQSTNGNLTNKKCCQANIYQATNPPQKKKALPKQNRSELFQGAMQASSRQTQGSILSSQSYQNNKAKVQASPTKDEQKVNQGQCQTQPQTKSIYTSMLLKQNKSKGNMLSKKNSLNAMPVVMGCSNSILKNNREKLHEKRTDSSSNNRNRRLARKFNSISPKMQDVIARGLKLKNTYVDPRQVENKDIQSILSIDRGNEEIAGQIQQSQKNMLAQPLRSLKGGLASQIQNVVNVHPSINSCLSTRAKQCSTTMKDYSKREARLGDDPKDIKMPKFKINNANISTNYTNALKSQGSLLTKQKSDATSSKKAPQQAKKCGKFDNNVKSQFDVRSQTQLQFVNGSGKSSLINQQKLSIDMGDKDSAQTQSGMAAKLNKPAFSQLQEAAAKAGYKAGGLDSSRPQRYNQRRQTSPNNQDLQKCSHDLTSRYHTKTAKDNKNLNSDLRIKTYEMTTIYEPNNHQAQGYQTDKAKNRRKTRNARGIKALDFKSSKNFTAYHLGAKSPSPSRLLASQYTMRGHERQQSSQHERQQYLKSSSPTKPKHQAYDRNFTGSSKKDKQSATEKTSELGIEQNQQRSKGQQEETSHQLNQQVTRLINCTESANLMNMQSSPLKKDLNNQTRNSQEVDATKSPIKSPSILKKAVSPSSSKSKNFQINLQRSRKGIPGLGNGSSAKQSAKKRGVRLGGQPAIPDPKKQRSSIFDTKVSIYDPQTDKVDYLETKMKQANISPIRKFADMHNQDQQSNEQMKSNSKNVDSSIANQSQNEDKRNTSMDQQADADIPSEKLETQVIDLDSQVKSQIAVLKMDYLMHSKSSREESLEPQIQAHIDNSCIAPSEMTTSTQRVRLKRENQDLKEQIEMIQRMLQQKDLTLQEKNDQLSIMQRQLYDIQNTQQAPVGTNDQLALNDGSDLLYKSIDLGQGLGHAKKGSINQKDIADERAQTINTMQYCSIDQANDFISAANRMEKGEVDGERQQLEVVQQVAKEIRVRDGGGASPGDDDPNPHEQLFCAFPQANRPLVVQLRRPTRAKNNRYKDCSPVEELTSSQQNQTAEQLCQDETSNTPASAGMQNSPKDKMIYTSTHYHKISVGARKPPSLKIAQGQELFASSCCSPSYRLNPPANSEISSTQLSGSFSSKYYPKADSAATQAEKKLSNQVAPGTVNYTESVVMNSATSSGQKEYSKRPSRIQVYHSKPTIKQIEPALQAKMDQLKNKLAGFLRKTSE